MRGLELGKTRILLRRGWSALWRLVNIFGYNGREYSILAHTGQRVYTPWFETDEKTAFSKALARVKRGGRLWVAPDRCFVLHHLTSVAAKELPGKPMAECGVYTGGTAQLMAEAVLQGGGAPVSIHLFDTFEGMPETSIPKRDFHKPGDFGDTSLEAVQSRLAAYPFCAFHKGFMPDTFVEISGESGFSLVHVDVDIYPSVLACLEWFWPRMSSGGVVVFDDYGFYPYRLSARVAVDEFFEHRLETPWPLPTGQAIVVKR